MSISFGHNRYTLQVDKLDTHLDVLAFEGHEYLSQPYLYRIEFTASDLDIGAEKFIGQYAEFSLFDDPATRLVIPWEEPKPPIPLRTLYGRITACQRLSGSIDEARYEVTLQPRLALLDRGQQTRIYQRQSVPDIVKSILRARHGLDTGHFRFSLKREYPPREQVMQYQESDLAFISRILAEVGIWYRCIRHEKVAFDMVEFCDDQRCYQFDVELPLRSPSGFSNSEKDSVWGLQTRHQVVEKQVSIRAYHPEDSRAYLDAEVDQTLGEPRTHGVATTRGVADNTYGDAYHYAEPYSVLGKSHLRDETLQTESGFFFARLRHERYLNNQTHLSGTSSSATLAPGQVLTISGDVPKAFTPRVVIKKVTLRAARDRSLTCDFEAMPYALRLCFRPEVPPKPQIAGTLPARITHPETRPLYTEIDDHGRYRVKFLFDRDTWPPGRESKWLRQARAYAGDTYGLHLPLIAGTEVAIAFEQGDPDKPYIAHALHDDQHPDLVSSRYRHRNHHRNVLRTPANNKLRMDDTRGQEHVKLSTEYGGKSQLNLGHLVDGKRVKRGEGFELRTDDWGSLRAGKGVFISADAQAKAQGPVLDMDAAAARLQQAGEQLQQLSTDAQTAKAEPADVAAQLNLLRQDLEQLKSQVLLLSAPQGIALTSGKHLQLAAKDNLMLNAGGEADLSVIKRLFIGVGQGVSLFVRKLGIKLIANQGPVSVQAQNDKLELIARHGLDITSTEDEIHITAKKKIVLNGGGSYLSLDECCIESGTAGDHKIKAAYYDYSGPASMKATHPDYPQSLSKQTLRFNFPQAANAARHNWAGMPYTLYADGAVLKKGVLDKTGQLSIDHQVVTRAYRLVMANGVAYQIPVPTEYRNAEQAQLANRGLHNHSSQADAEVSQPASHTDHRTQYATQMDATDPKGEIK
jgi:type VI secretion system secreted protein VgrG